MWCYIIGNHDHQHGTDIMLMKIQSTANITVQEETSEKFKENDATAGNLIWRLC